MAEARRTEQIQMEVLPRWLSYEDCRRLYGFSRWFWWRRAQEGQVRVAKIGSSVRLDRLSIEDLFERRADGYTRAPEWRDEAVAGPSDGE